MSTDYDGLEARTLAMAPTHPIGLEYGGRHNNLFVLQREQLSLLARSNRWMGNAKLDFGAEAEAYDPIHHEIVVAGGRTIQIFSETLDPTSRSLVEDLSGDGKLTLRFDPRTGDLFAMRAGRPIVQRYHRGRSGYQRVIDGAWRSIQAGLIRLRSPWFDVRQRQRLSEAVPGRPSVH